jgi:hypothetical protein
MPTRATLASDILNRIVELNGIAERILFSDEATFYASGKRNHKKVRIWGSENPQLLNTYAATIRQDSWLEECCE